MRAPLLDTLTRRQADMLGASTPRASLPTKKIATMVISTLAKTGATSARRIEKLWPSK